MQEEVEAETARAKVAVKVASPRLSSAAAVWLRVKTVLDPILG